MVNRSFAHLQNQPHWAGTPEVGMSGQESPMSYTALSLQLWTIFLHLPAASSALLSQASPPWALPMGGGLTPGPGHQRSWGSACGDWAEFIVAAAAW